MTGKEEFGSGIMAKSFRLRASAQHRQHVVPETTGMGRSSCTKPVCDIYMTDIKLFRTCVSSTFLLLHPHSFFLSLLQFRPPVLVPRKSCDALSIPPADPCSMVVDGSWIHVRQRQAGL